jgi:hypothetical protein
MENIKVGSPYVRVGTQHRSDDNIFVRDQVVVRAGQWENTPGICEELWSLYREGISPLPPQWGGGGGSAANSSTKLKNWLDNTDIIVPVNTIIRGSWGVTQFHSIPGWGRGRGWWHRKVIISGYHHPVASGNGLYPPTFKIRNTLSTFVLTGNCPLGKPPGT